MTLLRDPEGNETRYLHDFVSLSGKRVLEIGCGEGRLTWRYAHSAGQVVGIDPDPIRLIQAQRECSAELRSSVHFARTNALDLPFPPETFEVAILAWSL
jgi:ubiquinone/menaquinone biosynthesis C-methylase UbiE